VKRSFLDSVLRGAEALAARDPVGTLPDPDLLRRFAAGRDPSAFAVLVRRHGPLVWGVCRNLLPADADAEDAFQATFLALVRSAGGIRRTEALGGWLHGVAYRVALKARRSAARRKKREVVAAVPEPDSPVPDAAWDELQAAVHEELCRLPDKLRLPFVLCGLQGRSQKEAAEVLGWKVGTVSGRLSEARRRLLDRLARRGVPVGVAVGAAVLGGVAGRAAVPHALSVKVLSAAGKPAAVSPSVLSLARGVTPVYLTRTKMIAAGVVLAGLLTTGIGTGLLSTAGAQAPTPADPNAEMLKNYYDALRAHQNPPSRFEYKFVALDINRPLTPTDLQKVLATGDQEGWSYCGSQDLAAEKTGKVAPHMVFKRLRAGAAAGPDRADASVEARRALAAAQEADRDRTTLIDRLKRQEAEAATQRARAEEATAVADRARKVADEQARAERAAREAAEAKERSIHAQLLDELDLAVRNAAKAKDVGAGDKTRQRELEDLRFKYEDLLRKVDPLKSKGPVGVKPADPELWDSAVVKLAHVDGKSAVADLARVMPQAKIVAEVTPNSITLRGPAKVVAEARAVIENLDTPPWASADDKPATAIIALKHANAPDVAKALGSALKGTQVKLTYDSASNSLLVTGPAKVVEDIKKAVAELDKAGEAKK
jgi:RNA polymerase sigma factor (sigma-70 family)